MKRKELCSVSVDSQVTKIRKNQMTIFDLDNDCVNLIVSYLSKKDKFSLSSTCIYYDEILKKRSTIVYSLQALKMFLIYGNDNTAAIDLKKIGAYEIFYYDLDYKHCLADKYASRDIRGKLEINSYFASEISEFWNNTFQDRCQIHGRAACMFRKLRLDILFGRYICISTYDNLTAKALGLIKNEQRLFVISSDKNETSIDEKLLVKFMKFYQFAASEKIRRSIVETLHYLITEAYCYWDIKISYIPTKLKKHRVGSFYKILPIRDLEDFGVTVSEFVHVNSLFKNCDRKLAVFHSLELINNL